MKIMFFAGKKPSSSISIQTLPCKNTRFPVLIARDGL